MFSCIPYHNSVQPYGWDQFTKQVLFSTIFKIIYSLYKERRAGTVGDSVYLAFGMFGVSNPSRNRPKSKIQVVTAPLPNIQQQVWVRRVLGDKHYMYTDALCHNRCGILKNTYCSMAMSAEYRSKYKALHR